MTSYFSLTYLWIFLPLTMLLYQVMPRKYRWAVLLGSSYCMLWAFSQWLLLYLVFSTLCVYGVGLLLSSLTQKKKEALKAVEKQEKKAAKAAFQRRMRLVMLVGVLSNLGLLILLRYMGFLTDNINALMHLFGSEGQIQWVHLLAPMGISFYTMEAISYVMDVYRETIPAERNFCRLALYMSFFPQLMEGPICRYSETAHALWAGAPITRSSASRGSQRILFGVLKKMVVADQLQLITEPIFTSFTTDGGLVALGTLAYTLQLYMDFSGTMDLVIGSAEIFQVRLTENFSQPFLSRTVSEFWRRWHITLGTWFRDYIFYPVSISKSLKHALTGWKARFGARSAAVVSGAAALFCVWICNGLWHGGGWNYVFFGMYHFVLILLGTIAEPYVEKLAGACHIDRDSRWYHGFQILRTFLLVCLGELFFRAPFLHTGLQMAHGLFFNFSAASFLGTLRQEPQRVLVILGILVPILIVHLMREKQIDVREKIGQLPVVLRWAIWIAVILMIIIFGAYGPGYLPVDPMYANF